MIWIASLLAHGIVMKSHQLLLAVTVLTGFSFVASLGSADGIRLKNGDVIRGRVVSLDDRQLVIESENFGEMTVPRKKVELIGLGDKPIQRMLAPPPGPTGSGGPSATDTLPSLQNPQVQSQLNRLMQEALGGGMGEMQQRTRETSEGLRDLQRDLGPGSSADALDGYIKMFELFGGGSASPRGGAAENLPEN